MTSFEWMQEQFIKTGNLQQRVDLSKIVAPDIRSEAMALAGK
jgi:hypothetical protein